MGHFYQVLPCPRKASDSNLIPLDSSDLELPALVLAQMEQLALYLDLEDLPGA